MAVYFLNIKSFGRSNGSGAVSAAAYRSGERIHDARTGKTYDHSDRLDVMHKEIVLPSRFSGDDVEWARERSQLWNAAEAAENRRNARVAREYLVALPVELSPEQRVGLVRGFSRELSDRYQFAVDVSIHAPRDFPDSDPRNFHAHLLATTREVTTAGLGPKTTLEWGDGRRREVGLGPGVNEYFHARERWASVTNEALKEANVSARIDHRTLAAQGIEREPRPYIPKTAFELERRGYRSVLAERLRAEYGERVATRAAQSVSLVEPSGAIKDSAAPLESRKPQSLEDVRREARESWLRMRQSPAVSNASAGASAGAGRERDDEHGL